MLSARMFLNFLHGVQCQLSRSEDFDASHVHVIRTMFVEQLVQSMEDFRIPLWWRKSRACSSVSVIACISWVMTETHDWKPCRGLCQASWILPDFDLKLDFGAGSNRVVMSINKMCNSYGIQNCCGLCFTTHLQVVIIVPVFLILVR